MNATDYAAFFVGAGLNVFGIFLLSDVYQKKAPATTGLPVGFGILALGAGLTLLSTRHPKRGAR
jgi:multisubunit Na+/H+ antiporter MnhG subunit